MSELQKELWEMSILLKYRLNIISQNKTCFQEASTLSSLPFALWDSDLYETPIEVEL